MAQPAEGTDPKEDLTPADILRRLEQRRLGRIRKDLHKYCRYIDIPGAPVVEDSCPQGEACDDPHCELHETTTGFYNDTVTPAEHHDLLNEKLSQLADAGDELNRLMVFMPPGSAKSTYGTVTFPTWYMANNPGYPIICASFSSTQAKRFARRCRQICQSPKYAEMAGAILRPDNRAVDDWALTNGASFLAGGVLSGLAGNRARALVIDDPIKGREDADSPVIREKTWQAYNDDLRTRLIPGGIQLIIQTRWHEDDLSGRILPREWDGESGWVTSQIGERWYVLCLEAQCTREDDPLGREIGEFLWTDWFPEEHWETEKRAGSRRWASLYQQRPRPQEGSIIHRQWIQRYRTPPSEFLRIVQSWDTAYKPEQINDPSVCTTWGETRNAYYLLHVFRQRLAYPELKRYAVNLYLRWDASCMLVEDKASGQSLIQELRQGIQVDEDPGTGDRRPLEADEYHRLAQLFTPVVVAIEPQGDKLTRLVDVSSMIEAKQVFLPEHADWLVDFEMELFGFPIVTNDDQVDSTSQYLSYARKGKSVIAAHGLGRTRAGLAEEKTNRKQGRKLANRLGVGRRNRNGGM